MFSYENERVRSDLDEMKDRMQGLEHLAGKTVLVTGATGMIATYCVLFLHHLNQTANAGIQIKALVRNRQKAEQRFAPLLGKAGFSLVMQDITQPIALQAPCDYILHMAGSASAYATTHDPEGIILANVLGTKNVLDFARQTPACRVLFSSTREVYGKLPDTVSCITEDMVGRLDQTQARSCYPESKRMAENLLAVYHQQYGVDFVNARIAHAYGPGMAFAQDGRVMADLLGDALSGRDIVLKSNGLMKRAFCYVSDCVVALLTLLLHGVEGETYHIANETEEISVRDLAMEIAASVPEKQLKVAYREATEEEQRGYLQIQRVRLSTQKIEALGWKPTVSLAEGIRRTLAVGGAAQ